MTPTPVRPTMSLPDTCRCRHHQSAKKPCYRICNKSNRDQTCCCCCCIDADPTTTQLPLFVVTDVHSTVEPSKAHGRFTSGFVLQCGYLATQKSNLKQHVQVVHEKLREYQCVSVSVFLSPVVLSTRQLCRKSFTKSGDLRRHEKSKQHQLRLMNGGGDDDFFFNSNSRQRRLTISTNSPTTLTTVAK
jgi:hypothetical protein